MKDILDTQIDGNVDIQIDNMKDILDNQIDEVQIDRQIIGKIDEIYIKWIDSQIDG